MIEKARDVIEGKAEQVSIEMDVENIDRTFASTLSYEISRWILSYRIVARIFSNVAETETENSCIVSFLLPFKLLSMPSDA